MKIPHSQLQTIISEEIQASDIKPLFDKLISQLGALDKSIDFLAASVTGMDPFDIDIAQKAYGRFASPHRHRQAAAGKNTELEEGPADAIRGVKKTITKKFNFAPDPSKMNPMKVINRLKENTAMKLTSAKIREMVTEVLGELSEEKEEWAQEAAKDIEKKGTEGEFTKYCGGDVTQSCVDKAARGNSTKRKRQAAFAANINSSDDLTYPKEKKKKKE